MFTNGLKRAAEDKSARAAVLHCRCAVLRCLFFSNYQEPSFIPALPSDLKPDHQI